MLLPIKEKFEIACLTLFVLNLTKRSTTADVVKTVRHSLLLSFGELVIVINYHQPFQCLEELMKRL